MSMKYATRWGIIFMILFTSISFPLIVVKADDFGCATSNSGTVNIRGDGNTGIIGKLRFGQLAQIDRNPSEFSDYYHTTLGWVAKSVTHIVSCDSGTIPTTTSTTTPNIVISGTGCVATNGTNVNIRAQDNDDVIVGLMSYRDVKPIVSEDNGWYYIIEGKVAKSVTHQVSCNTTGTTNAGTDSTVTVNSSNSDCPYTATDLGDGLVVVNPPRGLNTNRLHKSFQFLSANVQNVQGRGNSSFRVIYVQSAAEARMFDPYFRDSNAGQYFVAIYDGCHLYPVTQGDPRTADNILVVKVDNAVSAEYTTLHEACHWAGGADGAWSSDWYEKNGAHPHREFSGTADCHYWHTYGGTTPAGQVIRERDSVIWQAYHNACNTDICNQMRAFVFGS